MRFGAANNDDQPEEYHFPQYSPVCLPGGNARWAVAAKKTAELIESCLARVEQDDKIVERVSGNLQSAEGLSSGSAKSIRQLHLTSQSQCGSIEQTATSAGEMAEQAARLYKITGQFKLNGMEAPPPDTSRQNCLGAEEQSAFALYRKNVM